MFKILKYLSIWIQLEVKYYFEEKSYTFDS